MYSIHGAATSPLIIRTVRRNNWDMLDTCEHTSIGGRYAIKVTQDIPYNTVSIHIPIIDILPIGGSVVFAVAILTIPPTQLPGKYAVGCVDFVRDWTPPTAASELRRVIAGDGHVYSPMYSVWVADNPHIRERHVGQR